MVKVRGRNSNGKTVKQTVKNDRKISGDDAARPAWVMVPGVSSSRLRPDSDQSRIWCRARPWLGCDSLNELCGTLTSDNLFFFFILFVSWVLFDKTVTEYSSVQSVTQGTWYSGRSSMLSSDSWLIDIGERSHPNPMHRSSLFQRDFQNR